MQGKAAYYRPLWLGPSPKPAHSGSFSTPGYPLCLSNQLTLNIDNGLNLFSYCLDNVTLDELVNWVCDDCEKNELPITNSNAVTPGTDLPEHSHAVQPVHDPIWRGGFDIWNKEYKTFGGLVAHLSIKTCQRDSEEAKSFTTYLRFEMVPKSDLWPKCFNTSKASDDDIAVYFFPSKARYKQDFDHLIEDMIGGEHALRAFMPNADLMVFTSIELPLHYWRFQQKHYLWGVFRAKQGSSSHQSGIKSVIRQTPKNVLAARDEINIVNDRIHDEVDIQVTEVDTQIMTDVLRRGKRIKMPNVRLADYV